MDSVAQCEVQDLPLSEVLVGELLAADSPRRSGIDTEHVRLLAQHDGKLPPILVHEPSMRVVDGMHRLLAAKARGEERIWAHLWAGDAANAFVMAVRANVTHGLPLSLADRRSAAERIVRSHPHWSDRMIAAGSGLSPKTVASVRACLSEEDQHLDTRVGRDGRARPIDMAQRRADAARLITQNPDLSLRAVAKQVGIAPETVRQVRAKLASDARVIPLNGADRAVSAGGNKSRQSVRLQGTTSVRQTRAGAMDLERSLRILFGDPALRSTETGRMLLRVLSTTFVLEQRAADLAESIPVHNLGLVAAVADANAVIWRRLAETVTRRGDSA